jgi:hypothetical protein
MRRALVAGLVLAIGAPAGADTVAGAGAPRAHVTVRAPLPALAEAAVASDGAATWVVFRPDDSPPYAARVTEARLVPGPRVNGIFSPSELLGATEQGLWFGTPSSVIRVSPRTGHVTLRLTPRRGAPIPWQAAGVARAQQLVWSGSTLVDAQRGQLLGQLAAPPLVGAPVRTAGSFWLAGGNAVRRFDAGTGRLRATIRWPGWIPTAGPVLLRGTLWVAFQHTTLAASEIDLRAVDPRTGALGATLKLAAIPGSEDSAVIMRAVDLHAAAGALWLVRPQVGKAYARLYRLDPGTGAATPEVAVPYTNLTRIAWRGPQFWTSDGRVVMGVAVR